MTKSVIYRFMSFDNKTFMFFFYVSLPIIKRGAEIESIFPTTDNLLIQYDFDKCVFEEDSPYQNVKIMHSNQYGNVLILDNDVSK